MTQRAHSDCSRDNSAAGSAWPRASHRTIAGSGPVAPSNSSIESSCLGAKSAPRCGPICCHNPSSPVTSKTGSFFLYADGVDSRPIAGAAGSCFLAVFVKHALPAIGSICWGPFHLMETRIPRAGVDHILCDADRPSLRRPRREPANWEPGRNRGSRCSGSLEMGHIQGAAALFGLAAPTPSNASRNCAAEGKRSFGFFSSRRLISG